MKTNYVITIGRQVGSGGKKIGEYLSERLGIPCYDKELLHLAATESGLDKEFFEKVDEKRHRSFFSNYFGFRVGYMSANPGNYLCDETLFNIQSDVIRSLAEKESCIFVGRCADYVLRKHPRIINFFISADMEDRVHRMIKERPITKPALRRLLMDEDKKRSDYYNYFSNKTWGVATSYDVCVNSSILGLEETSGFVENFVLDFLKK